MILTPLARSANSRPGFTSLRCPHLCYGSRQVDGHLIARAMVRSRWPSGACVRRLDFWPMMNALGFTYVSLTSDLLVPLLTTDRLTLADGTVDHKPEFRVGCRLLG